jgi:hypothetical protein
MGVDYFVHVGPFLTGTPKLIPTTYKLVACSNKECKKYGKSTSTKFCSDCGGQIVESEIVKEEPKCTYEISEEIKELFYENSGYGSDDSEHIWLLNKHIKGIQSGTIDLKDDGDTEEEYSPESIVRGIEILKKEAKKELEILQKYYDPLEIKWGVITRVG